MKKCHFVFLVTFILLFNSITVLAQDQDNHRESEHSAEVASIYPAGIVETVSRSQVNYCDGGRFTMSCNTRRNGKTGRVKTSYELYVYSGNENDVIVTHSKTLAYDAAVTYYLGGEDRVYGTAGRTGLSGVLEKSFTKLNSISLILTEHALTYSNNGRTTRWSGLTMQ